MSTYCCIHAKSNRYSPYAICLGSTHDAIVMLRLACDQIRREQAPSKTGVSVTSSFACNNCDRNGICSALHIPLRRRGT